MMTVRECGLRMTDFTPKIRLKVDVNVRNISNMKARFEGYSVAEITQMCETILNSTFEAEMKDLKEWIVKHVPRATGQLQDNLLANLDSSTCTGLKLRIRIGTYITYAPYVENYSNYNVRHFGQVAYLYYYGYHGRTILNDPEAVGHFFTRLLFYAAVRLQYWLGVYKDLMARAISTGKGSANYKPNNFGGLIG